MNRNEYYPYYHYSRKSYYKIYNYFPDKVNHSFQNYHDKSEYYYNFQDKAKYKSQKQVTSLPAPPVLSSNQSFHSKKNILTISKVHFTKEALKSKKVCSHIKENFKKFDESSQSRLVSILLENFIELTQEYTTQDLSMFIAQNCSPSDYNKIIQGTIGNIKNLMVNRYSSKIIEFLIETCDDINIIQTMLHEIKNDIEELLMHQYGTFPLQKLIRKLKKLERYDLIADYILPCIFGNVFNLSISQCGSRVLEVILNFLSMSDKDRIIRELLLKYKTLCENIYGSFVICQMIDDLFCQGISIPHDFYSKIKGKIIEYMHEKNSCKVIYKLLTCGDEYIKNNIIAEVIYFDLMNNDVICELLSERFTSIFVKLIYKNGSQKIKDYLEKISGKSSHDLELEY